MTLIPDLERQLTEAAAAPVAGRRVLRAAAGALALAAAIAVLALATTGGDGGEGGRNRAPSGPLGLDLAPGAKPKLSDLFAVFRREQTPRDERGWTPKDVEQVPDRQPGEDFLDSRRADHPSGPMYLWPMKDGVCWSSSCIKLDVLLELGGVAIGTGSGRTSEGRVTQAEVRGLAIDGIDEVRLTRRGAPDIVVPVVENVFAIDVTDEDPLPQGARWTDPAGKEHRFGGTSLFGPALGAPAGGG